MPRIRSFLSVFRKNSLRHRLALLMLAIASIAESSPRLALTAKDLRGPNRRFCIEALTKLGQQVASGKVKMSIGHFGNLEDLLMRAQMGDYDVIGVIAWIEKEMERGSRHPIYKRTLDLLKRERDDPNIFICVLRGECTFQGSDVGEMKAVFGHLTTADESNFALDGIAPLPLNQRRRPAAWNSDPSELHAIYVKALNSGLEKSLDDGRGSRRELIQTIAHETTHAADAVLLYEWIDANYKLIEHGKFADVDPLFNKLVREHNGKVVIDATLRKTLLESRGYAVSDYVEELHASEMGNGGDFRSGHRFAATAIADIRSIGGGWFLDQHKITEKNIFEFGERLGRQFERTIEKAKDLH